MANQLNINIWDSISSFNQDLIDQWKSFINDANPFIHPHFFKILEDSKCIGKEAGWNPLYFVAQAEGKLVSLVVAFVKTHSYGEYIFDWQWANTYEHYSIPYYPKLTVAIPHSPVSAPKFIGDQEIIKNSIMPVIAQFSKQYQMSGTHFLFTNESENKILSELNYKIRDSLQYHWHNQQYEAFEDYLESLKKNRRKTIKRERRAIRETGIRIEKLSGTKVCSRDIDFFYKCYEDTIDKKYSMGYLNHQFFNDLFAHFPDQTTLVMAFEEDTPIAASLFLSSENTLYGRYWGCTKEIEFLHFELCLYQGIELAIEKKLTVFEAGAQGEHKRMRGFTPVLTKSAHYLEHPEFRRAINHFIDEESNQLNEIREELDKRNSLKTKV